MASPWWIIAVIGGGVGFFGGLFGAGGSAVGTLLLHVVGVPAFVALASPLPAAVLIALAASRAYWERGYVDRRTVTWSIAIGLPATVGGALLTPYVGGPLLIQITEGVIAAIGVRLAVFPREPSERVGEDAGMFRVRLILVAAAVGVFSGLLANSGGFLLTPLYLVVLRLPIKRALATSLAVSAALAVPGTVTHWALGHIDWSITAVYAAAAAPLAYLGARLAIRANPQRLTRVYGTALALLATGLLLFHR
ncbi:sulfite exporter TauE/SafE family protein [Actinopolymorpha alba]|uniref:sulfite exporter TauE/SafE family protein n=1 Tax=Actinopolymorpha alba TaxID=533267 RepID=UPI00036E1D07|nr:sulfite exporter TauE/SafE family protein [Actinopolymorpha alba]